MMKNRMQYLWPALLAVPMLASAQTEPRPTPVPAADVPAPAPAPPHAPKVGPPILQIASASALSTERLGSVMSVQELPDGRVLVNDGVRRRLLLMDSTLQNVHVVLDSLTDVANSYGTRPGALLPYRGDTTLFMDPASYAMLVLDPQGRVVRVRSVWRVQDVGWLTSPSGMYGWPGIDAKGRMVYRVRAVPARPLVPPPSGIPYFPPDPDSAFVVAVNLDTRHIDTVGVVRIPKNELRVRRTGDNSFAIDAVVNPLPFTDDWAVLPDGTIAFVRGIDYRIEYLNADGSTTSSAKLPYEWVRVTDDDKERLVDSVRTAQQRVMATQHVTALIRWVNQYNQNYPASLTIPEGYVVPPGFPRDWILPPGVQFPERYTYACAPGAEPTSGPGMAGGMVTVSGPPAASAAGAPAGAAGAAPAPTPCLPAPVLFNTSGMIPPMPTLRTIHVLSPSELPDYRPPLPMASTRADLEGNLWIRTNPARPIPGGPVYDIVSREGELVTRYQLPPGYAIVGFGRNKVVYLTMRDPAGLKLARVMLR